MNMYQVSGYDNLDYIQLIDVKFDENKEEEQLDLVNLNINDIFGLNYIVNKFGLDKNFIKS